MEDNSTIFTLTGGHIDIEGFNSDSNYDICQDDEESLVTGVRLRNQEERNQKKLKTIIFILMIATMLVITMLTYWVLNHSNMVNTKKTRDSFVEFLENLE